jgi:transcriptional regulator with XRE-family HTH domain
MRSGAIAVRPELKHLTVSPPGNLLDSMVRAIRKARKLSAAGLSQAIGRDARYICDLENGRMESPPYAVVRDIWRTLDVDPDDIPASLQEANPMTPPATPSEPQLRLDVGGAIHEQRLRRGLSRTDLARRSGVSLSHVSRIERGLSMPSYAMVEVIAGALETDLTAFTRFTDRASQADAVLGQVLTGAGVPPEDLAIILQTSLKARERLAGLFAEPQSIPRRDDSTD